MLYRPRVVLKGREEVCMRWVSCIPRIVGKRDVRQLQRKGYLIKIAVFRLEPGYLALRGRPQKKDHQEAKENEKREGSGFPQLPEVLLLYVVEPQYFFAVVVLHELLCLTDRIDRDKFEAHRTVDVAALN